jgi:hypothetical protein
MEGDGGEKEIPPLTMQGVKLLVPLMLD